MSDPKTQLVETPNVSIAYLEYGSPGGVPLILLHGFPDAPAAWRGVIGHLDAAKYRILVPWLRGFGETKVNSQDMVGGQGAALGTDLLAFADALGVGSFHLAGHDWGATAAYAAAVLAPERIKTLLTIGSPYAMYGGKEYPPEQVRAHWYQWYFQLELGRKMMEEDAKAFCHELWRAWSPGWDFARGDFAEAAKSWKNPQFAATVIHYYRSKWGGTLSLRAYEAAQAQLNAKPKPKIEVPTLFIQGGADACDPPPCSEDDKSFFSSGYERVVIKGAGHFPHREDPKAVAKVLIGQLEG